jgi:cation diffusion facilitator CzcD-associated flavoprotein CzcO
MVWVFGYLRAAWTLRADLVSDFVCKLLGHMEVRQARMVTPALRP